MLVPSGNGFSLDLKNLTGAGSTGIAGSVTVA
jgi:hypothetical protein